MMRDCIIDVNGKIINIGEWDYQIQPVQVGMKTVVVKETVLDEKGNIIEPEVTEEQPVYEDKATNPLPSDAVLEQRDIVKASDGSLVEFGYVDPDKALIDAISGATTLAELQVALVGGVTNARVRGKRI